MNKVFLVGRLTRDPELRQAGASAVSVCTFTLAIDRRRGRNGEKEADFIPIVVWREQGENCAKYLRKGSEAAVCGSIQTRSYDANDGSKRYVTEVVADEVQFVGARADRSEGGEGGYQAARKPAPQRQSAPAADIEVEDIEDGELPF